MPALDNSVKITVTSEADTKGLQQASKSVQDLGNSNKEAAPKAEEHEGKVSALSGTVGKLAAVFAGTQIIGTITNFGKELLGSAGELEQTNMSFQSLIGNTDQANKLFGQLMQYANTTPFQAADVTGAAKQLLAFGETAGDTTRIVKQLGDVAAAGGGDLQAMSLVTGQVFAQGKMRAQDMYQVINDGGAGLIKIMAQNAGGMQNLTAEFDKGGIPAQQYFDAINQAAGQGGFAFNGALKQAGTLNGQISTLKDTVTQFGLKMLGVKMDPEMGLVVEKGGLFDRLKEGISFVINALTELSKHKVAVEAIAGAIGGVLLGAVVALGVVFIATFGWIPLLIVGIAMAVGALVAIIIGNWDKIKDFTVKVWQAIYNWIKGVIDDIKAIFQAIGDFFKRIWTDIENAVKTVFKAIGTAFKAVYDVTIKPVLDLWILGFKIWWTVVSYIFDVFRGLALVTWWFIYNNVVQPVMQAITTAVQWAGNVISTIWNWIKDVATTAWNWVWQNVISPVINAIAAGANWIGGIVTGVWNWIKDVASSAWNGISGFVSGVWNGIKNAASDAAGHVANVFGGIWGGIRDGFKTGINWIIDQINKLIHGVNNTAGKLPGVPKIPDIPKFSSGVNNFDGGYAILGERGPELAYLPKGSNVTPASQTSKMMTGHQITIQQLVLPNVTDKKSFIEAMDTDTVLAGRGLTPNMGMR